MCIHWKYLFLLCFQSAALSYDMCRERLKAKNLVYVMQILQILEGFLKFLKRKHHACHFNSWVIPPHLLSCSLPILSYGPKRMRVEVAQCVSICTVCMHTIVHFCFRDDEYN